MARYSCKLVAGAFAVLYALALAVLIIGTFGLFGQERDPLAGVFLVPLGMPWNRAVDLFPEPLWPWLAALAPVLNLLLLLAVCRVLPTSRRR